MQMKEIGPCVCGLSVERQGKRTSSVGVLEPAGLMTYPADQFSADLG